MVHQLIDWLTQYQFIFISMGVASTLIFVLSLLALPWLISKIPTDYFSRSPETLASWSALLHPRNLIRNLLGIPVLLAGVLMLVLPGQGILTILLGLAIMQFPGKPRLERWLIGRPGVLPTLNWMRRKTKVAELHVTLE